MEFCLKIVKRLNLPQSIITVPDKTMNGKSYMEMLTQFSAVFSSRLHCSICCYSLKIPTVAMSWDNKIDEFYTSTGRSHLCFKPSAILAANLPTIFDRIISEPVDDTFFNSYRNKIVEYIKLKIKK